MPIIIVLARDMGTEGSGQPEIHETVSNQIRVKSMGQRLHPSLQINRQLMVAGRWRHVFFHGVAAGEVAVLLL